MAELPMHMHGDTPSPWIRRFAHLVPAGAHVLDLASGGGRHARFFAARGCRVLAADRDAAAMAALDGVAGVSRQVVDLERGEWPFGTLRFDAIVVANYLHRPLFPQFAAALATDGVLLYETFASGNEVFGRPRNPDFLLEPAELLDIFGPVMTVVAFEQGETRHAEGAAVVQRFAAVGRGRPWPPLLQAVPPPSLA
jgi:SAM-dependent methyltransferase